MHNLVKANAWVVLRLPSDNLKVLQVVPNTPISLGKYGTFPSNLIIDRPYNLKYELVDRQKDQKYSDLRIVPASEIHADTIAEEDAAANPVSDDNVIIGGDGVEFELVGENGEVIMRSNRETIDDSARQTLTQEEIETLKRDGAAAGKDLIAKLMLSHTALDEKTAFSLAKYKLLKTRKYLRQFTILPMDVAMMDYWMMKEKDASKIMEFRDEMLALAGSWANVHFSEDPENEHTDALNTSGGGRLLVVDETGGLLVAAMAERMGLLYPEEDQDLPTEFTGAVEEAQADKEPAPRHQSDRQYRPYANTNTLTLIHTNSQPNLSLLKYFNFNIDSPAASHPLTKRLLPISWLQLISPESDSLYSSPPPSATPEELSKWSSGKRGTHFRKKRRWERIRHIISTTQHGDFTGLVVASNMDPISIIRRTIHLLRPSATIAIYSPTIEPLVALADLYSTSRRTAFIQAPPEELKGLSQAEIATWQGNEDFPLNPSLILNASVQSCRKREWQVLPGRTHPLMTSRGGAEGYLFTGTRVVPAEGKVEARGKFAKRTKVVDGGVGASKRATDDTQEIANKKIKLETESLNVQTDRKSDIDMEI
ncbi:hypothetical protein SS1G_01835 [Sclerotinia sclerotiorum 1980 UF-70]|uniref:tRNA (adenine(58)-N(1))-methyltransferase non-catalytic subunit TRM6 n=2 Tax=Sclerotinia sclerotiorum (strain ATCC 18683 / 1980 / Ss-1) TaxID=665079 RepID=A7E955_SCLS1|nr:hypothetical protein SS1G_01835 [Sclerotinia sclerotiorum 1980 UF-70]APA05796.1 hypothetical protein sscle_01g005660 [Sclerotinia sclerotiorum 1980 UF-70]EDN96907.1 hypothetical protein SS1G_01835 [Sclerotinia sclerotiorum 1980 UF-70]